MVGDVYCYLFYHLHRIHFSIFYLLCFSSSVFLHRAKSILVDIGSFSRVSMNIGSQILKVHEI